MSKAESRRGEESAVPAAGGAPVSGISGRLSSLVQRSGGLVDKLAGSVKEASRSALLKQALDARDRGNLAAAFYLLEEESGNQPDDVDVSTTFWDVAVAYARSEAATSAVAGLIRRHASQGALELASQYWMELNALQPEALVEAPTLARIVPHLQERVAELEGAEADEEREAAHAAHQGALVAALRGMVSEENEGLTPGLALHAAEQARDLDPPSALAAARIALESDVLHEAKRRRLYELIAELDPDAPPPPPLPEDPVSLEGGALDAESRGGPGSEGADAEKSSHASAAANELPPGRRGSAERPRPRDHDPARNHPLRTESPPIARMSDEEIEALQARLPPRLEDVIKTEAPAPSAEEGSTPVQEPIAAGESSASSAVPEPEASSESRQPLAAGESSDQLEPLEVDEPSGVSGISEVSEPVEIDSAQPTAGLLEGDATSEDVAPPHAGEPRAAIDSVGADVPLAGEESLVADESPAPGEPTAADGPPVPDEPIAAREPPAADEPLVADDSSVGVQPLDADEPPAADEPIAANESSAADESLAADEALVEDESLGAGEPAPAADRSATEDPLDANDPLHTGEPLETDDSLDSLGIDDPLFGAIKVLEGQPTALEAAGLAFSVSGGTKTRIGFDQVEALGVGEVRGLADEPVIVIDLLLNWRTHLEDGPLRVVRMRSDAFDPTALVPGESDSAAALRTMLAAILAGSAAVPLPDPDCALGLVVQSYDSIEHYHRNVLQIGL